MEPVHQQSGSWKRVHRHARVPWWGAKIILHLLRYDMSELQEMGRGVEIWAAEAAERNWNVSLHRVKTWPQLMCYALI